MKINPLSWMLCTAALAVVSSGCATHEQHSFNADYNQHLTTAPNYFVEDRDANSFTITASQGKPSSGAEQFIDVKRAASAVAAHETRRRGWQNWQLDYIAEYDQGWIHVVKAQVVRRNAVEYKPRRPDKQAA